MFFSQAQDQEGSSGHDGVAYECSCQYGCLVRLTVARILLASVL
jgi:hypothetical protein